MTDKEVQAARRDLKKSIAGAVVGMRDRSYPTSIAIDNGRVHRTPFLVVAPSSTNDVSIAVKYCRTHDIRLTTKSGGHGAAGYCLNSDGIVLALTNLDYIRPHDGGAQLTVGMGTRWIRLYQYLQEKLSDRVAIGGGCAGVGLGGFLLGGGYSFVSRSYGLACDNVTRMEFVSADGDVHRLNETLTNRDERDLFWALRGGGGGNFGIVSAVDLNLPRRPTTKMMMGTVTFPFDRARELLRFYNDWISTLPNEMAVYGMLRRLPDPAQGGDPVLGLRLTPIFNGAISEGMARLKPLIDMSPTSIEIHAMTLPQWESFMGNGTALNGRAAYIRSAIMPPRSLSPEVIDILLKYMNHAPSKDSFIVWTHAGGRIREVRDDSTCFAHRDAELVFELKSIWESSAPRHTRANVEWAVSFFDELDAYAQGAYVNYIDPLLQDWQRKYYRGSYRRLVKIREHWDPTGYFTFQQGIGSDFSPSRAKPIDISPLSKT
jgi:hypothetical protein